MIIDTPYGALAQLVERNNGIVEVNGSTPLRSKLNTKNMKLGNES